MLASIKLPPLEPGAAPAAPASPCRRAACQSELLDSRALQKQRLTNTQNLPQVLQRLLSKHEVLACAGPLFDRLELAATQPEARREQMTTDDVWAHATAVGAQQAPNLLALLQVENAQFLAYVRFAPAPWRFRDFLRALCPLADDRELDAFTAWRRGQCRPSSRASLRRALDAARLLEDLPVPSPSRAGWSEKPEPGAEDRAEFKQYVQQRFLELMMQEGLDPTSAAARALRDAQERR